jgi:hypothetical protein
MPEAPNVPSPMSSDRAMALHLITRALESLAQAREVLWLTPQDDFEEYSRFVATELLLRDILMGSLLDYMQDSPEGWMEEAEE